MRQRPPAQVGNSLNGEAPMSFRLNRKTWDGVCNEDVAAPLLPHYEVKNRGRRVDKEPSRCRHRPSRTFLLDAGPCAGGFHKLLAGVVERAAATPLRRENIEQLRIDGFALLLRRLELTNAFH